MTQLALTLSAPQSPGLPSPTDLLPAPMGSVVSEVFRCMEVAEEEIETTGLTAEQRREAFGILVPSGPLRGKAVEVYRAHVREILGRLARGEDLKPGTDAECLCACLYAAGDAPLRQEGQAVTEWLFARVFPERAAAVIGEDRARERWDGQVLEDVAQLRRRLAVERKAA